MENLPDTELASAVGRLPGVRVTHHYRGQGQRADTYFVHLAVESEAALDRLIELAEAANAPLHIYGSSKTGYCYTLLVNGYSREIVLAYPPKRRLTDH